MLVLHIIAKHNVNLKSKLCQINFQQLATTSWLV